MRDFYSYASANSSNSTIRLSNLFYETIRKCFEFEILRAEIVPGMSLRWSYPRGVGGNYEKENTICIARAGPLTYIGHPFEKPLLRDRMTEAIEDKTGITGTKPDLVTTIPWTKLPD